MSQADRIRQYAADTYILPARRDGKQDVVIRAGDLHNQMALRNAMPAVCSALRSSKFEVFAGVTRLDIAGPVNGANVYFRFGLTPRPAKCSSLPSQLKSFARTVAPTARELDLHDAIVLVSCVKSKLPRAAPARQLYCSTWFTKVRSAIESHDARWFVLSALYGLVEPNREIEPYEHTLNTVGVVERRAWADRVFHNLVPHLKDCRRVVFFAGLRYREFLVGSLQSRGWQVDVPMEDMRIGEQLAWLTSQQ